MTKTEEFIKKAKGIHGDKYNYTKVNYIDCNTKVCIICPEHGEFWQSPRCHLRGRGCSLCSKNKKLTTEEFIKRSREIHGDKYDYSKVNYVNNHTKVCIICPEHGEFWQKPISHLNGHGCVKCYTKDCADRFSLTTKEFIKKAKDIHGDKYDYSKVNYVNSYTKVCIICPEHGEFWQDPHTHLSGYGCKECSKEYRSIIQSRGVDWFIEKARKVHCDKYDYSKVKYVNKDTKVCIICPKHGEFWQSPKSHLEGYGCSICGSSHLELQVFKLLKENGYTFEVEKTFDWLKNINNLYLDFYIPNIKIAIECQGKQHFISSDFYGGEKTLNEIKERDLLKRKLCDKNGIKILYFTNIILDEYPYEVITDLNELMKNIKDNQI